MGRDLYWYIIPKKIEHDATKPVCLSLEYEPDEDEIYELIYEHVNGKDDRGALRQTMKELTYNYRYRHEHRHKWCPKCFMLVNGIHAFPLVIAHEHIGHSYSNPIWNSDWNIKDMYMGTSSTPFIRRFSKYKMYREISKQDIDRAYQDIEQLGECMRTSDREAKKETLMILDFLSKYSDDENVMIILSDEF